MKRVFFMSSFILIFLLIISLTSFAQACVTLNTFKTDYLPGETFQVEIDGTNNAREIYTNDLVLYKQPGNYIISVNPFLVKISNNKSFAWFDLPSSPGNYTFKVKVFCGNNPFLPSVSFKIEKPKSFYYNNLKTMAIGRWNALSLEEHTIIGGVLSYDASISQEMLESYYARRDSCVNTNCSAKDANLDLIVFKDFSTKTKIKNLLDAYQNNLRGSWYLELESNTSQTCNQYTENTSRILNLLPGTNKITLDFSNYFNLTQVSLRDECDLTSRKLVFSYNNLTKKFDIANTFVLNNPGCFGNGLKASCEPDATAYALIAMNLAGFQINDKDKALEWLGQGNTNAIDQVAILYFFTRNQNYLDQVLVNQNYDGSWQKQGSSSVKTTALIYHILNHVDNKTTNILDALSKASNYLDDNLDNMSEIEKAYTLFFIFPDIEPIVSIWPGIVKTKSGDSFNFILQNRGNEDIRAVVSILNSSVSTDISKNSMVNLRFSVPFITTTDGRIVAETMLVQYSNKRANSMTKIYSVPVIIFSERGQENINSGFTINQNQINQSQQQNIINQTLNQSVINQTSQLNETLIRSRFYFNETNITKNISTSDLFYFSVELVNRLPRAITDIKLRSSASMPGLRTEPIEISELKSNEKKVIRISVNPNEVGRDGTLKAIGTYNGQEITTELYLKFNVSIPLELKTCAEYGGEVCAEDKICQNDNATRAKSNEDEEEIVKCCLSKCIKEPTGNRTLGIIIVVVTIIILVIVLVILRKKPHKEMKEFAEEVSKKYQPEYKPNAIEQGSDFGPDFEQEFKDFESNDEQ